MSQQPKESKAWGGVFTVDTDHRVELFTESISFDKRLYEQDIRCSIAHANMLRGVGLLTDKEFAKIENGLLTIKRSIEDGTFEYSVSLEDIHMHIEHKLIEMIGDTGRKLHTARSRNDQVVTDLRVWVRGAIEHIDLRLLELQRAFVGRCDSDFDVIIPAYTHTQRAQPVIAPHYWLCYCEKFERDRQRLADCRKRVNVLGLGAAALAGTSLPIDRHYTAELLDFDAVAANSLDVSSDRDFVLEFAFDLTQIALHLSTLAEEWIYWSTFEFNFIRCPQSFCTGSSIMPQKVNPDVLELIRGKTARVVGSLQSLIVLTKGLPLAYNRDLQEDKEPIFNAFDTVNAALSLAAPLVADATLNRESIAERLEFGYLDATAFMEYLIQRGVPQRTAHGIVGKLVRRAMNQNLPLAKLSIDEFREVCGDIDDNVYNYLGAKNAVEVMQSYGSTSPKQVREQIEIWKKRVEESC
ncbi:MAG: argininosuccinate lyase [Planctomycetaceae bacterium]|jgi:argininosuccinate lyase|nr:argininosuccinate lyase [Planctomycetaceae bacterium]